jgi:hypothetical protein
VFRSHIRVDVESFGFGRSTAILESSGPYHQHNRDLYGKPRLGRPSLIGGSPFFITIRASGDFRDRARRFPAFDYYLHKTRGLRGGARAGQNAYKPETTRACLSHDAA